MASRSCLTPGCPNFASYRGRCKSCAAEKERTKRAGKDDIYHTKKWDRTRNHKLRLNGLCEYVDPDEGYCTAIATDVHHKQDIADGGDKWSMANLEALCHSHHSQITRARNMTKEMA